MPNFQSLAGFRDFYPEEFAVRAHIFGVWREVARRYGFKEYDGPPLEPLGLYVEKSGPEIVEQLYNFVDKGDREVTLRPEMTPTFARMVGARAGGLRKPVKWFSVPQLFRYERAQRGRLREHFQLNMDIVGEADVLADAELLAAAIDVMRAFGLAPDDVVARVSDRRLLRGLLLHAGVPEEGLPLAYNIVDKRERDSREGITARLLGELGLGPAAAARVLAIFDIRDFDSLRESLAGEPQLAEDFERISAFLRHLEGMGLGEFVRFDLSVVRGLAYYTGIVWELFDARGELRAIAGGGRYDHLLRQVSGTDLPALGFGMGDVVLRELLADRGKLPELANQADFFLIGITEEQQPALLALAHELRDAGHSVEYGLRQQGVGRQFKNAAAAGARRAVVIGPDEAEQGKAVVRNMVTGEETTVLQSDLARG